MANPGLIIIDGDFKTPREVEGSGGISIDEVTRAKVVKRTYAVERSFFQPLLRADNPFAVIPDAVFPDCILVEEMFDSIEGPILYFSRVFSQIPAARTEPKLVTFTMPGKSGVQTSQYTGKAIYWSNYGSGSPYTRAILATSSFTYKAGNPQGLFTLPPLSQIFWDSPTGRVPVDWAGDVYELKGLRVGRPYYGPEVINNPSLLFITDVIEPDWRKVGQTIPPTVPSIWTSEIGVYRWRGCIWCLEVTQVPTS